MTRFRLTVEYDGRPFMGWQRQPHGPSVQAALEDAAKAITGEDIILHAAGRTDAGVHAEAMAATGLERRRKLEQMLRDYRGLRDLAPLQAEALPWMNRSHSLLLTLPPLAGIVLAYEG